jgi:hypothetical protein
MNYNCQELVFEYLNRDNKMKIIKSKIMDIEIGNNYLIDLVDNSTIIYKQSIIAEKIFELVSLCGDCDNYFYWYIDRDNRDYKHGNELCESCAIKYKYKFDCPNKYCYTKLYSNLRDMTCCENKD